MYFGHDAVMMLRYDALHRMIEDVLCTLTAVFFCSRKPQLQPFYAHFVKREAVMLMIMVTVLIEVLIKNAV